MEARRTLGPWQRGAAIAVVGVAALSLAACLSFPKPAQEEHTERATWLYVDNRTWSDVTIYVVRSSSKKRLGMVTSMSTGTFAIPGDFVQTSGELRLVADLIGSLSSLASEPINVWPGGHIEWTLQNALAQSTLTVW